MATAATPEGPLTGRDFVAMTADIGGDVLQVLRATDQRRVAKPMRSKDIVNAAVLGSFLRRSLDEVGSGEAAVDPGPSGFSRITSAMLLQMCDHEVWFGPMYIAMIDGKFEVAENEATAGMAMMEQVRKCDASGGCG